MFSTAARVRLSPLVLAVAIACCWTLVRASVHAQDATIFRIFLRDGESLVSYGEFARVADKVVFSVPLGDTSTTPALHMVSIPASIVDWPRTDEYANTVRAKRYAETRGEEDFALLASRVTQALNDINTTADPKRRIAMAEEARRNLAAWPAANYGYRAADVAQLVGMLDDVVAEMRSAAGEKSFSLSLFATTVAPPMQSEVLPAPTPQATLELAYRAAMTSTDPGERINLLRAVAAFPAPVEPTLATTMLRNQVEAALVVELSVEHAYQDLTRTALRDADQRARNGDPRALQQVIARVLSADDRLGHRRPGEMAALLAALDARLGEANRVRLERDAWAQRVEAVKEYRRSLRSIRQRMTELAVQLRAIRDRKAISVTGLKLADVKARVAIHELRIADVPSEASAAHNLLLTAFQLARHAATLSQDAISSKNTTLAWDASSAASGALMLADRAADELERLISAKDPIPR